MNRYRFTIAAVVLAGIALLIWRGLDSAAIGDAALSLRIEQLEAQLRAQQTLPQIATKQPPKHDNGDASWLPRLQQIESRLQAQQALIEAYARRTPPGNAATAVVDDTSTGAEDTLQETEPTQEQIVETRLAVRDSIDEHIGYEGINVELSEQLIDSISGTIETYVTAQGAIEDVTCSDTYCRIVIFHDEGQDQMDFLSQVQGREGFRDAGIAHVESDGTTYVYLAPGMEQFPLDLYLAD